MSDWTVDPETGRSNSSAEFLRLEDEIARLITSGGGQALSRAWARDAARLILAQLAHKHGFAPHGQPDIDALASWEDHRERKRSSTREDPA